MEKTKKRTKHYVNNPDFYAAIVEYKNLQKENPEVKITNYIGECISMICNKLSNRPNFSGYTYKSEMISDGVEACLKGINSFNPEKTNNPFAYFTRIAWNAFVQRIKEEHKQQYVKHKNAQHMYFSAEQGDMNYGDGGGTIQYQGNDISDDIITTFENRLTKNKKNVKISGVEKFLGE